jgi:hypothetical protein
MRSIAGIRARPQGRRGDERVSATTCPHRHGSRLAKADGVLFGRFGVGRWARRARLVKLLTMLIRLVITSSFGGAECELPQGARAPFRTVEQSMTLRGSVAADRPTA